MMYGRLHFTFFQLMTATQHLSYKIFKYKSTNISFVVSFFLNLFHEKVGKVFLIGLLFKV